MGIGAAPRSSRSEAPRSGLLGARGCVKPGCECSYLRACASLRAEQHFQLELHGAEVADQIFERVMRCDVQGVAGRSSILQPMVGSRGLTSGLQECCPTVTSCAV